MKFSANRLVMVAILGGLSLGGCQTNPSKPADANNPSPTAGSDSSAKANQMADKAMYKPIEYANAGIKGPALVIIPGEIKSNNATFTQKFGSNNIADFGELELSKANFGVLERTNLGPLLNEFQLAYTMGDPNAARKVLQKGKFKTTKWVVKFDILKAEQVAQAKEGFDGRAVGSLLGAFVPGVGGSAASTVVGSVQTGEATGVWIIGMRYKILNANTTEQVATGYTEEKMEVGSKSTSVMGVSSSQQGGLTLDGMVQRLVQKLVWEIDSKHKGSAQAEAPKPQSTESAPATKDKKPAVKAKPAPATATTK
jgi:outer membrane lipoprotein SlyB